MTAETIAKALGGRKTGGSWMARCPAHDDHEPSLSMRDAGDGNVLVRCHAGCEQERVIAALRSRGLWEENGYRRLTRSAPRAVANNQPDRDDTKRTEAALAIWRSAKPADGTLVETYLASRGLYIPPPPTLRFHAGLKHPSGGIGFVRLSSILAPRGRIPVSKSTWWAGVKSGRYPKAVKLGPRITAWRVEDIRALIQAGSEK